MGNYSVVGSVCCLFVRLSVCRPLFSGMVRPRELIFSAVVGYRSATKPIDFVVNGYIFEVEGHENIGFDIISHSYIYG